MSNSKTILYIGNNNSMHTSYVNTMFTLSNLLEKENYTVIKSSSKKNKLIRLIDMCLAVIKNRNHVDYILIDTFSTLNFYFAFAVSQLARIFNIQYLPILHGGNLPFRISSSEKLSKLIFYNSYKNIAPSNYLKKAFEAKGYKVTFVPNVIEIERYQFKNRLKLKPKLLWVRAFKKLYNPILAVEVLVHLKKLYPDVKLCMIGPKIDNSFQDVSDFVQENDLKRHVEFTGVLSQEDWHKKSVDFDFIINTTNFDNTPVSIMEAMALGLQVVSTNVGGMPFLINNGVDGILVEKENSLLMSKIISELIEKESNLMTSNARNKVEQYGWNVVRNKWIEILK